MLSQGTLEAAQDSWVGPKTLLVHGATPSHLPSFVLTLAELPISAFPLDAELPPSTLSDLPYLACSHQITTIR